MTGIEWIRDLLLLGDVFGRVLSILSAADKWGCVLPLPLSEFCWVRA